ncbi:murein biosynthesis integral membrane protein MurJ [Romboutsia ilealis]|uniref:Probable lipid II flippase MurJ n=1 Tax=Romboutsia faecis TaxID=2764597 RepID=A0ABR7JLV1_9FIRM|nr:murein biosynthesis integral membrane protein MurJ [Romboutsia faecis]MBC5995810.1 murein biosynthesis integral membrane protein MurJ [Romboutsia faecis]MRN23009.1 murein biosynthesis integral membrane protein MurJ [Romboutsia ilealis]
MNKVAKTTIVLMIITLLSKILGFARELALTYVYGATEISDVYITSSTIPITLFTSVGTALATTFIPLFYELDKNNQREKSLKFTNNIFNIVTLITIIVSILGYIFAEPLVKLFAMDFSGDKLKIAVDFTRIMIFGIVFIALSQMMTAWLQISGKFAIPGMIGFPFNICIILGIIISSKGNINIMAIGTLIAMVSQFLFQLPFAIKNGYKYKLYVNLNDEYLKKMLWLITPVFIGVGVNQINSIVDRSLASTLGDGIITVLNSANRLNSFVLGLFISTIAAVIYPNLSKLSNESDKKKFAESVAQSVNTVVLLIIPISVGAIVLANPVVRVVFERGAFNSDATNMTAIALSCYSIGMIGFSLREILNKVFYSLQDTKTPMVNGALAMGMNIVLNFILIRFLGHVGLALATSISALICIALLFNSLKKKIGYFGQDKIISTMAKSLVAAVCMGGITRLVYNLLDNNIIGSGLIQDVVVLFSSIGVGAMVYFVLVVLFKVEEVNVVVNMVKSKSNRKFEYNGMKKIKN